ncbi:hypothetical protein CL614_03375 [archaeon]|nr:hypothetical protein [archaeon]
MSRKTNIKLSNKEPFSEPKISPLVFHNNQIHDNLFKGFRNSFNLSLEYLKLDTMIITAETELEQSIIDSEVFQTGAAFNKSKGEGHPEKNTGEHITQILDFVDIMPWEDYRTDLRIIGLFHDLGKPDVVYSESGHIVGDPHSFISEQIARDFIDNEDILYAIRMHDRYFRFYKNNERGKFKQDKFLRTFQPANLPLLTRFNYADSNNRKKDSVVWFEDKSAELGLISEKVYEINPKVLSSP